MSLLHEIHQRAQERGLRFLLIGGFAVNAHGHSQDAVDLARVNNLDLRSEKFRGLFAKYGNMRLYEQVLRFTGQSGR